MFCLVRFLLTTSDVKYAVYPNIITIDRLQDPYMEERTYERQVEKVRQMSHVLLQ